MSKLMPNRDEQLVLAAQEIVSKACEQMEDFHKLWVHRQELAEAIRTGNVERLTPRVLICLEDPRAPESQWVVLQPSRLELRTVTLVDALQETLERYSEKTVVSDLEGGWQDIPLQRTVESWNDERALKFLKELANLYRDRASYPHEEIICYAKFTNSTAKQLKWNGWVVIIRDGDVVGSNLDDYMGTQFPGATWEFKTIIPIRQKGQEVTTNK